MPRISNKERVDRLIAHFWQDGFLTLSRKFGTYLPPPEPIAGIEVDAIGKFKNKYVLAFLISQNDLEPPNLITKISRLTYLITRNSKRQAYFYIGASRDSIIKINDLLKSLNDHDKQFIKIIKVD